MLGGGSEEGASIYFFPEVEAGLVPVLGDIGKIVFDNRPDDVGCSVLVTIGNQPVGITDHGDGSKRWTIALGTAPTIGEGAQINVVLRLPETLTIRQRARRVGYGLQLGLRGDVVLDFCLEASIVGVDKPFHNGRENESGVSGPGIEVCKSKINIRSLEFLHARQKGDTEREGGAYSQGLRSTGMQ